MLGVSTGGRISVLLSLQIGDVYQNGSAVTDMLFEKSIVKGGEVSRAVPVNRDGRLAIDDLIAWHRWHYQNTDEIRPLFPSHHKSGTVPLHRQNAHAPKKRVYRSGIESFAQRWRDESGNWEPENFGVDRVITFVTEIKG